MRDESSAALAETRDMLRDLRALAEVTAPAGLRIRVLAELGLMDQYFPLETPLGQVFVAYSPRGISAVLRAASATEFETQFRGLLGREARRAEEMPTRLRESVERQLHGERQPSLRFDLRELSEFERAVLLKALEIPYGEVRPYAWVAREIGRPKAVRAVGTALGKNPVPLVIPCHRVVRSGGDLGQYSMGGPLAKRTILAAEGVDAIALETLAHAGVRYTGNDMTHVFCFPTCRHGRRVTPEHRRGFRSESEAFAAGYRPCKVCRPAVAKQA